MHYIEQQLIENNLLAVRLFLILSSPYWKYLQGCRRENGRLIAVFFKFHSGNNKQLKL